KMGASDEEMVMVAGFAGGLGLSGNACGALSAAIWMKSLDRCRKSEKTSYKDLNSDIYFEKFYASTDYEIACDKITGRTFKTVEDHTEYIKNGGCDKLINALAQL
ncbi:MAG: C_GCAxxG_C_C family protein, partial [Melioribacteraceae bacterium]|nr:C_GCAxxG_C_C family protein [Melioribacteraceae bacterium]